VPAKSDRHVTCVWMIEVLVLTRSSPNEVHDSRSAVMAMLDKLSLRLDVIVDFSRRNGHQGVFQIQRSVALLLGGPDVVQTVSTDAAGEVCMKLSRVAVSRAANGRPSVVCCSGFEIKEGGTSILGNALVKARSTSRADMAGQSIGTRQVARIGGAPDASRKTDGKGQPRARLGGEADLG
jgi:acetyl-CoA acetyltransferase